MDFFTKKFSIPLKVLKCLFCHITPKSPNDAKNHFLEHLGKNYQLSCPFDNCGRNFRVTKNLPVVAANGWFKIVKLVEKIFINIIYLFKPTKYKYHLRLQHDTVPWGKIHSCNTMLKNNDNSRIIPPLVEAAKSSKKGKYKTFQERIIPPMIEIESYSSDHIDGNDSDVRKRSEVLDNFDQIENENESEITKKLCPKTAEIPKMKNAEIHINRLERTLDEVISKNEVWKWSQHENYLSHYSLEIKISNRPKNPETPEIISRLEFKNQLNAV